MKIPVIHFGIWPQPKISLIGYQQLRLPKHAAGNNYVIVEMPEQEGTLVLLLVLVQFFVSYQCQQPLCCQSAAKKTEHNADNNAEESLVNATSSSAHNLQITCTPVRSAASASLL